MICGKCDGKGRVIESTLYERKRYSGSLALDNPDTRWSERKCTNCSGKGYEVADEFGDARREAKIKEQIKAITPQLERM